MASIARVQLEAGPARDLLDLLTELHIKAGEPPVRKISEIVEKELKRESISPDTVWRVLKGKQLSKWRYIECIVEALGGQADVVRPVFDLSRTAHVAPHKLSSAPKAATARVEPPPQAAPWRPIEPTEQQARELAVKNVPLVNTNLRTLKLMGPEWDGRERLTADVAASVIEVWRGAPRADQPSMVQPFTTGIAKNLPLADVLLIVRSFQEAGEYEVARLLVEAFGRTATIDGIKEAISELPRVGRGLQDSLLMTLAKHRSEVAQELMDIDAPAFVKLMDMIKDVLSGQNTRTWAASRPLPPAPNRAALEPSG